MYSERRWHRGTWRDCNRWRWKSTFPNGRKRHAPCLRGSQHETNSEQQGHQWQIRSRGTLGYSVGLCVLWKCRGRFRKRSEEVHAQVEATRRRTRRKETGLVQLSFPSQYLYLFYMLSVLGRSESEASISFPRIWKSASCIRTFFASA